MAAIPTHGGPSSPDEPILCGLNNLGNTCFANSAIQALSSVTPFVTAVRLSTGGGAATKDSFPMWRRLHRSTHVLPRQYLWEAVVGTFDDMQHGSALSVAPGRWLNGVAAIHDRFTLQQGEQHDAAEWLSAVVDSVDECFQTAGVAGPQAEALRQPTTAPSTGPRARYLQEAEILAAIDRANAKEEQDPSAYRAPRLHSSPAGNVFRGVAVSTICCSHCGYSSRTASEFTSLQLAFPTSEERTLYRRAMIDHERHMSTSELYDVPAQPKQRQHRAGRAHAGDGGASSSNVIVRLWIRLYGHVSGLFGWITRLFGGGGITEEQCGPLTLHELLWVHCRPELLTGSNRYRCPSDACKGRHRNATKTLRFLRLPEALIIQVKRFEFGSMWTSKIPDHVEFPLDIAQSEQPVLPPRPLNDTEVHLPVTTDNLTPSLCLAPYLYREGGPASALEPPPTIVTAPLEAPPESPKEADSTKNKYVRQTYHPSVGSAASMLDSVSSSIYGLRAVVNHHGSFYGGHYTSYCCRQSTDGSPAAWVLHNDSRAASATPETVSDSQAYLLVYQRVAAPPIGTGQHGEHPTARDRSVARQYLIGAGPGGGSSGTVYVPRVWLLKLASYTAVGPIPAQPCYCPKADRRLPVPSSQYTLAGVSDADLPPVGGDPTDRSNRHFHAPCAWAYVPVRSTDAAEWVHRFGADCPAGGLTEAEYDALARLESACTNSIDRAAAKAAPRRW